MGFGHSNAPGATYPELMQVQGIAQAARDAAIGGAGLAYSNAKTYAVGDYCNHDGKLYRCTTAINTPEDWTAAHWQETSVPAEVTGALAAAQAAKDAAAGGSDAAYSSSKTYQEGDYCNHDGLLYRCIVDIAQPEEWTPAHWMQTSLGAELASIRKQAEAGGSGGGNVIKVTFGPEFVGAEYVCTNGTDETKIGIVPEGRVVNISVTGCNTIYTIRAQAEGTEYHTIVETGPYYGQYSVALNVFTATINVTTAPGAVVTASCDGATFTATADNSGLAAVTVKRSGSYTVTAAKNGKISDDQTVNATTEGGAYSATCKLNITTTPTQGNVPSYTGNEITVELNDYNADELALGGTYKATNSGTHPATVTPKSGYQWPGGGTGAKTVNWTINKANGSLSLDKSNMALTGSAPNGSITAERAGDGTVRATSSNTAVATVTVNGNTITVNGLSDGTTTISVTVDEGTNHLAVTTAKTCTVTATDMVHIYGAQWDGSSSTKWTRTDEAAGFTDPVPYKSGMSAAQCSSPFDNKMPWSGMTKSNRTGGVMVAIPKFWYKLTANGNGLKIQIADKAQAGYSVSPAHMDRGDGKGERDVVYIGRYHCGNDFKSNTGQQPKGNVTRANFRTSIQNLGNTIWQNDFAMRFTLWLLYIVEYADWNSQKTIGAGCSDSNSLMNMGYTDSMPYHTGTTKADRATYGGTQYRNIEGLWDNVYDFCDGCYNNSSGFNIIKNPASFSDNANGVCAGKPVDGWPKKFTVSTAGGFPLFYPTEAGGLETTYSCDYWYWYAGYPVVYVGGNYDQNGNHGLFCVNYTSVSDSHASYGSRLQELP